MLSLWLLSGNFLAKSIWHKFNQNRDQKDNTVYKVFALLMAGLISIHSTVYGFLGSAISDPRVQIQVIFSNLTKTGKIEELGTRGTNYTFKACYQYMIKFLFLP